VGPTCQRSGRRARGSLLVVLGRTVVKRGWAEMVTKAQSGYSIFFFYFLFPFCLLSYSKFKSSSKFKFKFLCDKYYFTLVVCFEHINCDEVILMIILFVLNNIPFSSLFSRISFRI
jgi:hypothetical protein